MRIRDGIDSDDDQPNNLDNYEALINLDENVTRPVPKQLIDLLPNTKFTQGNKENFSEENKSCTICMCPYELDEEYLILPCFHRFHSECIKEWLNRKNTCPNCKDNICEHFPEEMRQLVNQSNRIRPNLDDSEQMSDDSNGENNIGREYIRPMFTRIGRLSPFNPSNIPRPMDVERHMFMRPDLHYPIRIDNQEMDRPPMMLRRPPQER